MPKYKLEYEIVYPQIEYGMGMPSHKKQVVSAPNASRARAKGQSRVRSYNRGHKRARMSLHRVILA